MKRNVFYIVSWVAFLSTSCSFRNYYTPNVQNVPMFTEKKIFSGDISGSVGTANSSLEILAGLSLPSHMALTANYMAGGNKHNISDILKVSYFEGTAGFYTTFKDDAVFEVYGGFGKGSQNHTFANEKYIGQLNWTWVPDGTAYLSFSKLFIQPDIGFKNKWIEGAFSCRLSKLNFINIDVNNTVYHLNELNTLKQNTEPWLFEPAFTFRGGSKSVKVQMQIIFSRNLSNADLFEHLRFSAGLHFNLSGKKSEN